jgi:predicted GTPase
VAVKKRAVIGNEIRRCEIGATSRATRDRAADCDGNLGIDLTDLLNEVATSVVSPSASQVKLLQRLDSLRQRIAANRFHLALLGQFKRGKSTLLNALLGADILPTGVIPVTAIPTFYKPRRRRVSA